MPPMSSAFKQPMSSKCPQSLPQYILDPLVFLRPEILPWIPKSNWYLGGSGSTSPPVLYTLSRPLLDAQYIPVTDYTGDREQDLPAVFSLMITLLLIRIWTSRA